MLREFLSHNREELIERCRVKVAVRRAPKATPLELSHGIPLFLAQLTDIFPHAQRASLHAKDSAELHSSEFDIAQAADKHGRELLKHDFTIEQVVHDYGDLCQAITELAAERAAPIPVTEFGYLNSTLDNAIASAVASYSAQHDTASGESRLAARESLGTLANAMRNLLNTSILAVSAMRRGSVGTTGATAAALDRSLMAMRGLIDRTLADIRLDTSKVETDELIEIGPFIAAIQLAAVLEATSTQCELTVVVQPEIFVRGDRHLLAAAVANLLHCGVTSTQHSGEVSLTAHARDARVIIEIEDSCSSLPPEELRKIIADFDRRVAVRSRPGSTLDSARRAIEPNAGTLLAQAIPGKGFLFTISLPEAK